LLQQPRFHLVSLLYTHARVPACLPALPSWFAPFASLLFSLRFSSASLLLLLSLSLACVRVSLPACLPACLHWVWGAHHGYRDGPGQCVTPPADSPFALSQLLAFAFSFARRRRRSRAHDFRRARNATQSPLRASSQGTYTPHPPVLPPCTSHSLSHRFFLLLCGAGSIPVLPLTTWGT